MYGAGIALSEEEIYYIPVEGMVTEAYLCGKLETLFKKASEHNVKSNMKDSAAANNTDAGTERHVVCALDIKAILKHVTFDDPSAVFDAGVAAYLLNPLKIILHV